MKPACSIGSALENSAKSTSDNTKIFDPICLFSLFLSNVSPVFRNLSLIMALKHKNMSEGDLMSLKRTSKKRDSAGLLRHSIYFQIIKMKIQIFGLLPATS